MRILAFDDDEGIGEKGAIGVEGGAEWIKLGQRVIAATRQVLIAVLTGQDAERIDYNHRPECAPEWCRDRGQFAFWIDHKDRPAGALKKVRDEKTRALARSVRPENDRVPFAAIGHPPAIGIQLVVDEASQPDSIWRRAANDLMGPGRNHFPLAVAFQR